MQSELNNSKEKIDILDICNKILEWIFEAKVYEIYLDYVLIEYVFEIHFTIEFTLKFVFVIGTTLILY